MIEQEIILFLGVEVDRVLSFLLFILNCLEVDVALEAGISRLMISSTNSLALCKLQHSLGRDILLNKDLTMNSKFEPN